MTTTEFDVRRSAGLLVAAAGAPQILARRLAGPFEAVASVYCPLDGATAADTLLDRTLRWRSLVDELASAGTPEIVLEAARARLDAQDTSPASVVLFIDGRGEVLHEEVVPTATLPDRAVFAAPADLRPLLSWQHANPAHLVVAVDRTGADISSSRGRGAPTYTRTVVGPDDAIEHPATGGWAGLAQSRIQHRAEDSWQHNMAAVADAVVAEASAVEAEVVVLVGDVRAVQMLEDHLPTERPWVVRRIAGGRSADGSQLTRANAVAEALAEAALEQQNWVLHQFAEQRMYGGLAVEGERQTLAALAEDRVAVLIVSDRLTSESAWFGAEGTAVFSDSETAKLSGTFVRVGSLFDVAVRSALLTGARVRVVPDDADGLPADGIGALCRYARPD